jgi:hypothetical protein
MIKLFSGKMLSELFLAVERQCSDEIAETSEKMFLSTSTDTLIDNFYGKMKLSVPVLIKEKTTSQIKTQAIRGEQLPAGTSFVPGRLIEIEVVDYSVPFAGDARMFKYFPRNNSGWSMAATVERNQVIFTLTNWSTISGRDDVINNLREMSKSAILSMEDQLSRIAVETEQFNLSLLEKIKAAYEKRGKEIKMRVDSNNKLNPF